VGRFKIPSRLAKKLGIVVSVTLLEA